jgi:hypothetical protein
MGNGRFFDNTSNYDSEELDALWNNGIEFGRLSSYGDINNDGLIDSVALFDWKSPDAYIQNESGNFQLQPDIFADVTGARHCIMLDYNGDAIIDVLFFGGHNRTVLLRGEGNFQFANISASAGPFPAAHHGDAGDLTGDGLPDLILRYGEELFLLFNQDGESFIDRSNLLATHYRYIGREIGGSNNYMGIIDLDGDGDNDIFGEHFYFANLGFSDVPVSVEENEGAPQLPSQYKLHAAYPNPFNPTTTIKFDVPEAGNVRIIIYNILGQQVAELVNANLSAGSHQRVWNAAGVSSGIYLVRMEANNFTQTRKITLLR